MGGKVESAAGEIHRQANGLVDDVDGGEEEERRKHEVMGLEPDLTVDQAARADEDHGRQVEKVPLDIQVLLVVARGMRGHQATLPADGANRPGNGFRADGRLVDHFCGSYCQITYLPGAGPTGPTP
jgi:hypothetical protein